MEVIQEQSDISLQLNGALDIESVEEMRGVLLGYLEQHAKVVVDLSMVGSCDAAGAQLILALEKGAESSGKPFQLVAVSESVIRDCADIGIMIAPSYTSGSVLKKGLKEEQDSLHASVEVISAPVREGSDA